MGEETARLRLLGPVGLGALAHLACVFVASLVATILLFLGLNWAAYLGSVCLTIVYAGIALGGIVAGARAGARGWLVGLLAGAFSVALSFFLCLLTGMGDLFSPLTLGRWAAACLVGALGGAVGVNFTLG